MKTDGNYLVDPHGVECPAEAIPILLMKHSLNFKKPAYEGFVFALNDTSRHSGCRIMPLNSPRLFG